MPTLPSSFLPSRFLRSPHVQTMVPTLFRKPHSPAIVNALLETSDGDALLYRIRNTRNHRLVILSHGLEGSFDSTYIKGMSNALSDAGWDVLTWNMRGCGEVPNRLITWYHSGQSGDLRAIVNHALTLSYKEIALVGFSVGGNITLKYLGEEGRSLPQAISRAVVVSVPMDLRGSAESLARPSNALYMQYLLRPLRRRMRLKARQFPDTFNLKGLASIRTFRDFDTRFTAPFHGFRSVDEYWDSASSRHYLGSITIPTLALSAMDDPFLSPLCFPTDIATQHPHLYLETPKHGGHVGFITSLDLSQTWVEGRAVTFLSSTIGR